MSRVDFCNALFASLPASTISPLQRVQNAAARLVLQGLTENDGHEIGGQDIYRLKIDYITTQCAILFKTTAEYKS